MMRSLFSGVAGLKAHQVKMDIIGNNIANVNTVGYKSSRMTFSEIYSQTVRGAGTSSGGIGGTNPQQIGLGVTVGSIDVNHSKGSIQRTESVTDMMVDGNGFFVLSNDVNAQNKFYARAGNFVLDSLGYLVAPNGFKVLGTDEKPVQINKSQNKAATTTDAVTIKSNLNINDDYALNDKLTDIKTSLTLFDKLGRTNTTNVVFSKEVYKLAAATGPGGPITFRTIDVQDSKTNTSVLLPVPAVADRRFVGFDTNGLCTGLYSGSLVALAGGTAPTAIPVGTLSITVNASGTDPIVVPFNNASLQENGKFVLSQTAQATDVRSTAVTGIAPGTLNSFSIGPNGVVTGVFTNGERTDLATIQLADFDNPAGLMKLGANLFSVTNNSGAPRYGAPGSGSMGTIAPGALEMSNVDLAQEFTDMITTQRGFQANSKIITTSDEILGELVNLKR